MKLLRGGGIVIIFTFFLAATAFLALPNLTFAASGTIVPPDQYAWSDNGGYVNWNATSGNVSVTDTALTGYIWSAGFGWINLSPTNGGVTNNAGVLGGYAWGANAGWISFTGVTIDSNGVFHGHTVAQSTFGIMTFDCAYCDVRTTWHSSSGSSSPAPTTTAGGNGPPVPNAAPAAVLSNNTQPASGRIPATLVPTSRPSNIEPATKPPTPGTYRQQVTVPPVAVHRSVAIAPATATTTVVVPASISAISSNSTVSPVPVCSLFTCFFRSLWSFIQSFF